MSALERAKAFAKSRAARTALKIMPLALAAATAHAEVALHHNFAAYQGTGGGGGTTVPEPSTIVMLVTGLAAVPAGYGLSRLRRKKPPQ
jgi:hypothetical protein